MILDEFFKPNSTANLAEGLGDFRPTLGSKRDQGKSVRKWRRDRGLGEQNMDNDNLQGGRSDDEVKFFIDSEPAYYAVMDRFGDHIEFRGDDLVAPQRLWGAIQQTAGDAGGAADIAGLEDDRMGTDDELDEQGVAEGPTDDPRFQKMMGNIQKSTPALVSGYVALNFASEQRSKKIKGVSQNGKPMPDVIDNPEEFLSGKIEFTPDQVEKQLMAIGKKYGWDSIDSGQGQGYTEMFFDTSKEYTSNNQNLLAANIANTVGAINKFFNGMNNSLQATGLPGYKTDVWQGMGPPNDTNQIGDLSQIANIAKGKSTKSDPGTAIGKMILKYIPSYEAENDELGYDPEDFASALAIAKVYIAQGEEAGLRAQLKAQGHVGDMIDELLSDAGGSGLRTIWDLEEQDMAEGKLKINYDSWLSKVPNTINDKMKKVLRVMQDGKVRSRADMLRAAGIEPNPRGPSGVPGMEGTDYYLYKKGLLDVVDIVKGQKYFKISKNASQGMAEGSAADGSVNYTLGHTPDAEYVYSIYRDGKKEGTYHSVAQAREIMGNMKLTSPNREYKIERGARNKMAGPASQLPEQGMPKGHGNYAGDRPVNLGGVSMKKIQIGDTVRYIDQKAQVIDMSRDRERARITIPSSATTKTVLTSDLRQLGRGVLEGNDQQLSVQQLATVSDEALDTAYGYGRSSPGNTFGWQANLKSAAYAKQMIDQGVTDIEAISDAIHQGWNTTAQAFVQNPEQFDDTEKLRAAGKLEAKLQQRAKLMNIDYDQLPDDEQEKDRVVARALLQALTGQQDMAEAGYDSGDYSNDRHSDDYGRDLVPTGSGGSRFVNHGAHDHTRGRPAKTHGFSKNLPADPFGRTAGKIPSSARPKQELDPFRELDELSPATLARYKTKAGAAATAADSAGDRKTGDRRFSGIVKATKKQFDQDAKQSAQAVHESRLRLMASIIKTQ